MDNLNNPYMDKPKIILVEDSGKVSVNERIYLSNGTHLVNTSTPKPMVDIVGELIKFTNEEILQPVNMITPYIREDVEIDGKTNRRKRRKQESKKKKY